MEEGRPLLHLLIEEEKHDLISFILKDTVLKADPELSDSKTELTPLCAAIQSCSIESVRLLIEAGADINRPADAMTPTEWAASCGQA